MPDRNTPPGEHPFLTAKGLRLQQLGRKDEAVPMSMPVYPSALGRTESVDRQPVDPFDFEADRGKPIHNVRPSKAFPDPAELAGTSLDGHFRVRRVAQDSASFATSQLRAVGKLFIQISSDTRLPLAMGSAWITGPSTIATAAHNVFDSTTRQWSRALEFHAGFDYYADSPAEKCRITSCYLPRVYLDNPATNHDIAICYVDRNIGDIVDAKIETREVEDNAFFESNRVAIVGYPAGSGFDFGKQMWSSEGDYLFGQSSGGDSDFAPVMATSFGGGASGCPWVVQDPSGKSGRYVAVGVTSGHAKLRYARGEMNLSSLVSPFFGRRMFDQLADDQVFHQF